jgi:UDP-galactose transporter B1
MFPSLAIAKPIALVAITSSLASPFGYASLKHIDYITFILAKSCKLLPVMFLHVTLFRRKFPLHKYAVVIMVTLGVSLFTLYSSGAAAKAAKHASKSSDQANKLYGLLLLGINLLFDGLTNTVQDNIFASYKPYGGAQMMCAMNITATFLTTSYLLLAPYLSLTPLGTLFNLSGGDELTSALAFIRAYPQVGWDVLGFSLCGAIGQVAIYHMLATFGSIPLTTVTVTRKMLTMVLSVLWFGHAITGMQWVGVGSVFGGIGAEAGFKIWEKREKTQRLRNRSLSEAGKDRQEARIGGKKER